MLLVVEPKPLDEPPKPLPLDPNVDAPKFELPVEPVDVEVELVEPKPPVDDPNPVDVEPNAVAPDENPVVAVVAEPFVVELPVATTGGFELAYVDPGVTADTVGSLASASW